MKLRFRLHLALAVALVGLIYLAPASIAQSRDTSKHTIAMLRQTPPTTPPPVQPAPSTQPAPNTTQPDYTTRTNASDDLYRIDGFSWSSFIVGAILGGLIGYLMGRRPATPIGVRRDRAA